MAHKRPEERERYKDLMRESIKEGGYEDDFIVTKSGRRGQQDVHVQVDIPPVSLELPDDFPGKVSKNGQRSRRYSSHPTVFESMTGENRAVYLALFALLLVSAAVAWHGVAIGGVTYILHALEEYGLSQATLHALGTNAGAVQLEGGIEVGLASVLGLKATYALETEKK